MASTQLSVLGFNEALGGPSDFGKVLWAVTNRALRILPSTSWRSLTDPLVIRVEDGAISDVQLGGEGEVKVWINWRNAPPPSQPLDRRRFVEGAMVSDLIDVLRKLGH